jgi:hypothetical protein
MSLSAKEISVNHTEKEIEIPGRVSTKSISNGGLGGGGGGFWGTFFFFFFWGF